jgi:sugar phosphate isomerase/epimerase
VVTGFPKGHAPITNRLSLAQLTINDACGPALIEAAAAAGFDAVGLRVISPAGVPPHPPIAGNDALLREVEASLAATGISVLDVNSFWIRPTTTAEQFKPVVEAAVRLRAPYILVVIDDRDVGRGGDVFAACAALANQAHVGIALEFQPYGAVPSLGAALDVVRGAGLANIGLVLDTLHFCRSGGRATEVAALPAGTLAFVQLADAPFKSPSFSELRVESRGHRLLPGEGELPLLELMDALPPGITLDIETPNLRATSLPHAEQARLAATAARRFLAAWKTSKTGRQPPSA